MKRITSRLGGLLGGILGGAMVSGQALDLFISEYVEGSGNNKSLEVFNGTGATVDLGAYNLALVRNGGNGGFVDALPLSGMLADGAVYVVAISSADPAILAVADLTVGGSPLNFNGDDVLGLFRDGVLLDEVGAYGDVDWGANVTLRRVPEVFSPVATYDAAEWESLPSNTFDGLGAHTFAGAGEPDPEPSEHPAALAAEALASGEIVLTWTDAGGAVPPRGYLVLVATTATPAPPTDGVPPVADLDFSDGAGALTVPLGEQNVTLGGLSSETGYTFTFYPYTNGGLAVDYKTDGTPATASATTPPILLNEGFDTLGDWTVVTLGAEAEWAVANGVARANAFGSSGPADDWLVSPALALTASPSFFLRFEAALRFNDAGFDPALSVLESRDYDGSGTPAALRAATWTPLAVELQATETGGALVAYENIGLLGSSDPVYLAFRYQSSGTGGGDSEQWDLDNVRLVPSDEPVPTLTLSLDPAVVDEDAGAAAAILTVALSEAPASYPLEVQLESLDPGEATVPTSVTFASAADGLVRTVAVAAVADGVFDLDALVRIRASAPGVAGGEVTLVVRNVDPPPPLTLAVEPGAIFEDAGAGAATLTITLGAEPLGGYPVTVALQSDAEDEATLPAEVVFTAADNRVKVVPVAAVADGVVDQDQTVTLTATAPGFAVGSVPLEVIDVDRTPGNPVIGLFIEPATVAEGSTATGTILLSQATAEALFITLDSAHPDELTAPAGVVVAAGRSTASFTLDAIRDGIVDGPQEATILASAAGWSPASRTVTVTDVDVPPALLLELIPGSLEEGQSGVLVVGASTVPPGGLTVSLQSSDLTEATLASAVTLTPGEPTRSIPVVAVADGVVDDTQEVVIVATASGYPAASVSLEVRNRDVPRTATLSLRSTELREGETVLADLVLNTPVVLETRVLLASEADYRLPASVTIPAGGESASFLVSVVAGDGFEPTETKTLRVSVPGFPTAEATFTLLNTDPRGRLTAPLPDSSWVRDDAILISAAVADPLGTLEAVELLVDGVVVAVLEQGPFSYRYAIPEATATPAELRISARVRDATLGDELLAAVDVAVVYAPPRSAADFVEQAFLDLTGAAPEAGAAASYASLVEQGEARADVLLQILEDAAVRPARQAMETLLVTYDRFATRSELFTDNLLDLRLVDEEGNLVETILMPPMAAVAASDPVVFYGTESPLFPGGVRGLAHVLLHYKTEAQVRFGGSVGALGTTGFFTPLWHGRHGAQPTAQQIVQAAHRVATFALDPAGESGEMDPADFGRARFVEALVFAERPTAQTDIIFNPPNRRWAEDAQVGLLRTALWAEGGFGRAAVAGRDPRELAEELLFHPRYWNRFDYAWLQAVPDREAAGWHRSAWFDAFYYTEASWPWLYQVDHGWIFAGSDDVPRPAGAWWWDPALQWIWSREGVYPWIYRQETRTWLYYLRETRSPRVFWDLATEAWIAVE